MAIDPLVSRCQGSACLHLPDAEILLTVGLKFSCLQAKHDPDRANAPFPVNMDFQQYTGVSTKINL